MIPDDDKKPTPAEGAAELVELGARIERVERLQLADHEARRQRARDAENQYIGFAIGVIWTAALFYLIRR